MTGHAAGDIAVPGDYDGDARTDMAVFHSNGEWRIVGSTAGTFDLIQWGMAGDIPVHGDFDGDGKDDPAVYRPATGTWYAAKSSYDYSKFVQEAWGSYGDQPVPADYDGDGTTDIAVWRPTTGVWFIIKSSAPSTPIYHSFGVPGDTAVPSAYTKQIGAVIDGELSGPERIKPKNATGGTNLYSRNFGWSAPLVGLPGRSGMDAGFGISYNSLVWLKVGTAMVFDPDRSNVSPGFRFGFPVIEPIFYDKVREVWTYIMVQPDGTKTVLRQEAASNKYLTEDSSYLELRTSHATNPNDPVEEIEIEVSGTDGGTMFYNWKGGAFRCNKILDRNGNYIVVEHDSQGLLKKVTDTLGREINIAYNTELYPTAITQTWRQGNGEGSTTTHTWASFTYTDKTVTTDFDGSITGFYGPPNGTSIKVLDKVTYADGSATKFEYNDYIQVKKVSNIGGDSASHVLNYVSTNLDSPAADQTDCPRFTVTRTKVENFNVISGK